jgi:23S rRNA pseudouridine1911/1915/1917 synthase
MNREFLEEYEWTVRDEERGERIDRWIVGQLAGQATRTQVQIWVDNGLVTVSGKPVKANYKVQAHDEIVVRVPLPAELDVVAEPLPLDIVFEDEHLIVLNKPRGMVVHPAPGHVSGTVVNALLWHCRDLSGINGTLRPGIVHRIDKDTSGLLMAAKHDRAHHGLAEQLKAHSVTRHYMALVQGVLPHEKGTVDAPIGRDPRDRQAYTVLERNSKHAVTHFVVLERFREHTLLQLKLETGRTHQIRVHMKYIGHPLVGDPKYGSAKSMTLFEGQALHAQTLGFTHPISGAPLHFEAPLPPDFAALLDWLRTREH